MFVCHRMVEPLAEVGRVEEEQVWGKMRALQHQGAWLSCPRQWPLERALVFLRVKSCLVLMISQAYLPV